MRGSYSQEELGLTMAVDYKLNFQPDKSDTIDALHERAAKRIHALCVDNGGLYIKLGQSLAIQAAILPKPYRDAFANIFDKAPAIPFDQVEKVFMHEFGVHPDVAFDEFAREPIASASIAQVHKARLKRPAGQPEWKDGEGYVAVKVRKPAVSKQVEWSVFILWDLFAYRMLLWSYEKLFDLPISFVSKEVTKQMRKETNLFNEATNAEKTARFLAGEPSLVNKAMVPRVEWTWTGESVMTAEYISACKLTDKAELRRQNLSLRQTMDAATNVFAAMVFKFGFVHCDPHPGNILVRPHPENPKRPQIVLIDHGLYIELAEQFRIDYCRLWKSLFVADISTIEEIAQTWGIAKQNSDMFASMTLLRPHKLHHAKLGGAPREGTKQSTYDAQVGLKARLKDMLENEQLIPRELIFLTRTMRMMQANNQALGSVTNRINCLAHWAIAGLKAPSPLAPTSMKKLGAVGYVKTNLHNLLFRVSLMVVDVLFTLSQVRQWLLEWIGTTRGEGFEDVLQRQVTEMARTEFGVELDESSFAG
ncbi:hypothetical protein MNV49_007912 [Pseudohyphozyma bogoriensis]|nr:hypothetical protein MNV49_007912 [Pseudohyphozyma bogoriensis]